jgi:ABC-2 type transport system ATP-binding protein
MASPVRSTSEALVEVSDLAFGYSRGVHVLRDVNLSLRRGAVALVGLNGAGKTTLFNLLLGELEPTAGSIRVLGDTPNSRAAAGRAGRVGYLPQSFGFPPGVKTVDFVTYIGWLHGLDWEVSKTASIEVLQRVGLETRMNVKLGELSGGMLRRVGLAQSFVHDPELVLLDEPSSGLDPAQRVEIRDLVVEESARRSFLIATHHLDDIDRLARQVIVLHGGTPVFVGTPSELAARSTGRRPGLSAFEDAFLEMTTTTSSAGT